MAPARSDPEQLRINALLSRIEGSNARQRSSALDDLCQLLDRKNKNADVARLGDLPFHRVLEVLFRCSLDEKHAYLGKEARSTMVATRLEKCANAIRLTATVGAPTLKRKTIIALSDHVTQTLPGPDDEYVEPLMLNYVRALVAVFNHQSRVEILAGYSGDNWVICVEFITEEITRQLEITNEDGHSSAGSGRYYSFASSGTPRPGAGKSRVLLQELLDCLRNLVSATNAPVISKASDISTAVIPVLRIQGLGISQIQLYAFTILNHVLASVQIDDIKVAGNLAKDMIPLISCWWQGERAPKDALLISLRDELLKAISMSYHFLEHRLNAQDESLRKAIDELLDVLWGEYSRRGNDTRLQLEDLLFASRSSCGAFFSTELFSLRPHNMQSERKWAILESIAFLEDILWKTGDNNVQSGSDQNPYKKRKTADMSRVLQQLKSTDSGSRITALQVVPFLVHQGTWFSDGFTKLFSSIIVFVGDKHGTTSSWAMIACASLGLRQETSTDVWRPRWTQAWHLAAHTLGLPGSSRASCVLLRSIISGNHLPYHDMSEGINNIIAQNGPAVLVDSSLNLMLDLLRIHSAKLPGSSHLTCSHIVRWVFSKWNPDDVTFASIYAPFIPMRDLVNLLKACCGVECMPEEEHGLVPGGTLSHIRKIQAETASMTRYLLLNDTDDTFTSGSSVQTAKELVKPAQIADPGGSTTLKKLVLEFLSSKLEDLETLLSPSKAQSGEAPKLMSADRMQSLLLTCLTATLIMPELGSLNSTQSANLPAVIRGIVNSSLSPVLEASEGMDTLEVVLKVVRPCLPVLSTDALGQFTKNHHDGLLQILGDIALALQEHSNRFLSGQSVSDMMDIDDEFESQASKGSSGPKNEVIPRNMGSMDLHSGAYLSDIAMRLHFMNDIRKDISLVGLVPDSIIGHFVNMSDEEILACQGLIVEVLESDLVITPSNTFRLLERLSLTLGANEYQFCETAVCLCINALRVLSRQRVVVQGDLRDLMDQLYAHFVKVLLANSMLSSRAQCSLAELLFELLSADPQHGADHKRGDDNGLSSPRTVLLLLLRDSPMLVKHFIATRVSNIFSLFVLKVHDEVFVDVLESLPKEIDNIEGMALRLLVLSRLACRWPTLLRRCTYHIFETPGKTGQFTEYASRCIYDVSRSLNLGSPKELFELFSPQLLYTWLENDSIDDIPYSIFGFGSLVELLSSAQSEAAALMIMRGQHANVLHLAKTLEMTPAALVQHNFAKIMAYAIAHDQSVGSADQTNGDDWVRKQLGKDYYASTVYANFVDVIAIFFELMDQEEPVERYFSKDENLLYAAKSMTDMKSISASPVLLPPNQQPYFRARYLVNQLLYLVRKTEYEFGMLWTASCVVSITRRLLNSVYPALGSLHACSVLRKIRILIALTGNVACTSYPLEMLLHSLRPFITDSECADDALGICQYLIQQGCQHLSAVPSFFAGYSLSTLASLRVFLESSQSSTTQESQFKATMSKAQQFHTWLTNILTAYDSPAFYADDTYRHAFKSITLSASKIRSSGNAEKGSSESNLLLEILSDGTRETPLLNDSAKELALRMLCGDFSMPSQNQLDIIRTDEDAISKSSVVWKSCRTEALSESYLAWAGRVVGRSFAASGDIPPDLIKESSLSQHMRIAPGDRGSEKALLYLIQRLVSHADSKTAGLAESALRYVLSTAVAHDDKVLQQACVETLAGPLFLASEWTQYQIPPTDQPSTPFELNDDIFSQDAIAADNWLPALAQYLVQVINESTMLSCLPSLLTSVNGFVEEAFPFIVHLSLDLQLNGARPLKRKLSDAFKCWLASAEASTRDKVKLLINTILYLRVQPYPNENSITNRDQWLDIDYSVAASAASLCGMFKTALIFAELASATASNVRSSRRSSAIQGLDLTSTLLEICQNINDPDAYYGLPEQSSLPTVLARLDYENNGSKGLAFRGAQYDTHVRHRDPLAAQDAEALVKAFGTLGLSGLSQSLLQTQQGFDGASASLDDTFSTARKLEVWNLPAPPLADQHAVTTYRAYQSVVQAVDHRGVRDAVYKGLSMTMKKLTTGLSNDVHLREQLGALATLTELDEVLNVSGPQELEEIVGGFESRNSWMLRGRYEDVGHILSCRETTLSILSKQDNLRANANVSIVDARQMEIKSMLMASQIFRFHQASQQSLNVATSLHTLIAPCETLGLAVDAAIGIEVANSLWDHGEMTPSIRMLQAIEQNSQLHKQALPVSRSDLLTKIGHRISVAKLEKPHDIQRKYLDPALKNLKDKHKGQGAGRVFHQFAMFCDEQLQNPDGLEDLARLQKLLRGKSDEVAQLTSLIATTRNVEDRDKYRHQLRRERKWLDLDQQEVRRVEETRKEFVRLSLENYLLSLEASDEHNNDALRFTALWLEKSAEGFSNEAVWKHIGRVPTRKFATLMNQLSSRLVSQETPFQRLLIDLVERICVEHPYHGMYQIWSGTKVKPNKEDETAVLRHQATTNLAKRLSGNPAVSTIWQAIDRTSIKYAALAQEKNTKDSKPYKQNLKVSLKDSQAAQILSVGLVKYKIPPPTMHLELAADKDYSKVPFIVKLESAISIASGVSAPKIITAIGSDGKRYKQLVKSGNDDLRQDAIMEQVFAAVSSLLKLHRATQQRSLGIRTYKVLPLTSSCGLIEFVADTIPVHEWLMPAHQRYYPKDWTGSTCRKTIQDARDDSIEKKVGVFRSVMKNFHPVLRYFFMEHFVDPDEWFVRRTAYTRSTAAISMLGHVLGLGDRHGHNILLDRRTGEVVHIDLGIAFEMGRILPVPEQVPFRLTRDIVDGMGITETEGVFRRCCEFTLDALREETYSIMTILDVLRYDPLHSWSISPVRIAKLQDARRHGMMATEDVNEGTAASDVAGITLARRGVSGAMAVQTKVQGVPLATAQGHVLQQVNEPSEADRALEVVKKKLSKTLSVTATVYDLINQARDERNLAALYVGWGAYA